jgi:hypothetical protein
VGENIKTIRENFCAFVAGSNRQGFVVVARLGSRFTYEQSHAYRYKSFSTHPVATQISCPTLRISAIAGVSRDLTGRGVNGVKIFNHPPSGFSFSAKIKKTRSA